jgi:hypothetical protein
MGSVCPNRFAISRDGTELAVPICTSRPIGTPDGTVHRIVVVIHGDNRNGPDYFRYAMESVAAAGIEDALVVAPQFVTSDDIEENSLADDTLYWSSDGWKEGNESLSSSPDRPWRVSSFAVVDDLLAELATPGRFPAVSDVVIVGHSAGGQFVNRYAAGSAGAAFEGDIRFVVANPSSYLYFDPVRYDGDTGAFVIPETDCSDYDRYKYGMDRRNRYMRASSQSEIRDRYRDRSVTYLLGTQDTGEHDESLDVSCAGRIQGPNRLERGQRYFEYLGDYLGQDVYLRQSLVLVDGVGHDGEAMLNSAEARGVLLPTSGG